MSRIPAPPIVFYDPLPHTAPARDRDWVIETASDGRMEMQHMRLSTHQLVQLYCQLVLAIDRALHNTMPTRERQKEPTP